MDVANGSLPSCVESTGPAVGFACGHTSTGIYIGVTTPKWTVALLVGLDVSTVEARLTGRCGSRTSAAVPGEAGGVDPSTSDADAPIEASDGSLAKPVNDGVLRHSQEIVSTA